MSVGKHFTLPHFKSLLISRLGLVKNTGFAESLSNDLTKTRSVSSFRDLRQCDFTLKMNVDGKIMPVPGRSGARRPWGARKAFSSEFLIRVCHI